MQTIKFLRILKSCIMVGEGWGGIGGKAKPYPNPNPAGEP